jgi:predicted nucleic acid-binding protein
MGTLTYVDANVLINLFCDDKAKNEKAWAIVTDPNRDFLWSNCLKLEVVPKSLLQGKQIEVDTYFAFAADAQFVPTTDARLEEAYTLASKYALKSMDALHIACAQAGHAAEFLTFEKPTKPFFNIPPEELQIVSLY